MLILKSALTPGNCCSCCRFSFVCYYLFSDNAFFESFSESQILIPSMSFSDNPAAESEIDYSAFCSTVSLLLAASLAAALSLLAAFALAILIAFSLAFSGSSISIFLLITFCILISADSSGRFRPTLSRPENLIASVLSLPVNSGFHCGK